MNEENDLPKFCCWATQNLDGPILWLDSCPTIFMTPPPPIRRPVELLNENEQVFCLLSYPVLIGTKLLLEKIKNFFYYCKISSKNNPFKISLYLLKWFVQKRENATLMNPNANETDKFSKKNKGKNNSFN